MEIPQDKKASIKDLVGYTPETYLSDDEIGIIQAVFNGPNGNKVLKIIRKVMIPSISDPELPVEEMGKDVFMGSVDFKQVPESEVKPTVLGLQFAAKAVMGGIIQLKQIANVKEENPTESALRAMKNSVK